MVETPELDKQSAVLQEAAAVSEFYDWLQTEGVHLMRWRTDMTDTRMCLDHRCIDGRTINSIGRDQGACRRCNGTGFREVTGIEGWVADGRSPQQLLADYFKIDMDKIEAERRALLADIRTQNG